MTQHPPDELAAVLTDAFANMEEALVAYDADGRLLTCNPAFMAMYRYTAEQARPGVHFRELGEIDISQGNIVVEDEEGADYLARKAEYRRRLQGSFTVKLRDGRWIRTTDRRMGNGGFVSVHVDVTELKLAEAAMRRAEAEASRHRDELARVNGGLERQVAERTRELEAAKRLAEERARTDSLTGLRNRGAFFERARFVHEQSLRHGRGYGLVMLDVDGFKAINDAHGHLAGDAALRAVGERLAAAVRAEDVVGRIGGEEFAILLPEVDDASARLFAERVRGEVSDTPVRLASGPLRVTASVGVALLGEGEDCVEQVMLRADHALYRAKGTGRNRVEFAGPPVPLPVARLGEA